MAKQSIKDSFLGICPICRSKLKTENSKVIKSDSLIKLYHIECGGCNSSVLLAVFPVKDGVLTTMGMLTDIQKKDINLIKKSETITTDSVLALYDYINKKNEVNSKSKRRE